MVDQPAPAVTLGSQESCVHHWLIDNPNGETSRGVCKYCGAVREFRNYASRTQAHYRTNRTDRNNRSGG